MKVLGFLHNLKKFSFAAEDGGTLFIYPHIDDTTFSKKLYFLERVKLFSLIT